MRLLSSIRALALVTLLFAGGLHATEAPPAVADPALEARVMAVATELRCLVCQNQTIADSHADLAVDLRRQIREMLARGDNQRQVLDYMTARYGDFVLYRPPFKPSTLLLVGALGTLALVLRRRARLGADAFDADTPETDER